MKTRIGILLILALSVFGCTSESSPANTGGAEHDHEHAEGDHDHEHAEESDKSGK